METLYDFLSTDHERLDDLLNRAVENSAAIDMEAYGEFRRGLLKHIGIEEKIILPAVARLQNGRQADVANKLRLDHGALVALLVPPPSAGIVRTIMSILKVHNALEEREDGLYRLIDRLAGEERETILKRAKETPEVPALSHNDREGILEVTRRAVERAGYRADF